VEIPGTRGCGPIWPARWQYCRPDQLAPSIKELLVPLTTSCTATGRLHILSGLCAGPQPVGAENLSHQAILMNHIPGAATPLNPEIVQVGYAVGQRAQWGGLLEGSMRPVGVAEGAADSRSGSRSSSSRWQLPIQGSMIEFIRST
jgi:hypothetical protein